MDPKDKRLADCQRVIGYFFADPTLLETALTHSSLRSPDRDCNERLEFLGDSVLGLVITEELYHLLPDSAEGEMTRIKSAVVSRKSLYRASTQLGLAEYADYARGVGKRDELPTSVVANLVESVIGAIYLDAGYYPAREFVLRHLGDEIEDVLNDRGAKNYKSLLQHEVQQSTGVTPHYRTVEEEGPDHDKIFIVAAVIQGKEWGRASGANKKEAEQDAAKKALGAWSRRGRGRRRRPLDEPLEGDAKPTRKRRRKKTAKSETPAEVDVAVADAGAEAPEKPKAKKAAKKKATKKADKDKKAEKKAEKKSDKKAEKKADKKRETKDAPKAERPKRKKRAAKKAEVVADAEADAPKAEPRLKAKAPAKRPARKRRSKKTEAEPAAAEAAAAPAAEAPKPAPEPKPERRRKPETTPKRLSPQPVAEAAPKPKKKPAKKKAPKPAADFGAGILEGDATPAADEASVSPLLATDPEDASVHVKGRAKAPRQAKPDDEDGFAI
ncbi:MAG: ribonuclease III [Planctomycetota bacterium]|nr:ribonuclease III [Planctomycetota bacterium]